MTTNHKIKFTAAETGEIDTGNGRTCFLNSFTLGAFALTKKLKIKDSGDCYREYQTDLGGLEALELMSGSAIELISDTIAALGIVLAYTDTDECGPGHLNTYAWLVAGLGELLGQLVHENAEITYSLKESNAQPEQNPSNNEASTHRDDNKLYRFLERQVRADMKDKETLIKSINIDDILAKMRQA
jgi:hypothetical protein